MISDINKPTGLRIREIRVQRGLTLEQMAEMTGVSVSMLSAIERGLKSPTLNVLNKINSGLQISLSELFAPPRDVARKVVHRDDMRLLRLKKGCELRMMLEFNPRNRFEVMRQEIAPHTKWDSEPRFGGDIWEHCFPIRGNLVMRVGEERFFVREGEVFSFISDVNHSYINEGDDPLVVILMNAYC